MTITEIDQTIDAHPATPLAMKPTIARATEPAVEPYEPRQQAAGDLSPVRTAASDIAPLVVALIPFSLAIGAASAANGLSGLQAVAGAVFLMAGTAQLAATELIGSGSGLGLVAVTAVVINVRFVLYGAGFARWFADAPLRLRLFMATTLVDQNYLICESRFVEQTDVRWRTRYYLTTSGALVVAFVSCQIVGFRVGASLPEGLGLHMAAPVVFAGLLGKTARGSAHLSAALVSAPVLLLTVGLPGGLALPVAAVAGLTVGSMVGSRNKQTKTENNNKDKS